MALFLVLAMALISSATAINQDILIATQEMQRANYFTFVMLVNMAPNNALAGNMTFLMPNDKALAKTTMDRTSVLDFLLRHSIPSPLLIDHLEHFPTGSMIPASEPGFMFNVSNNGRRHFFLSNVRITSPNICTQGTSIRCHGIDGVVEPAMVPQPNIPPPAPTCTAAAPTPSSPPPHAGPVQVPAMIVAPSPSQVSPQKSPSCRSMGVDLLKMYFVLPLMILWLSV